MDRVHEDGFVVYLQPDLPAGGFTGTGEETLASCPSYAEAQRVRRTLQRLTPGGKCVIRFVGDTGGGD